MSKKGFKLNDIPHLVDPKKNWSLCIGAGTSVPIFPLWNGLVLELSRRMSLNNDISHLLNEFKADALIQTLFNLGFPNNEKLFCKELTDALYSNLESKLTEHEQHFIFKMLSNKVIIKSENKCKTYIDILKNKFEYCSAFEIAKAIVLSCYKNKMPKAILSFNAEPLLYSLINSLYYLESKKNESIMDIVNSSTSSMYKDRISYIFCHGVLPIPHAKQCNSDRFAALDKLVFLENEYLQLSNSAYSWQSSSFIDVLSSSIVFFIGVSLSDPNMRRWLAWMHENKIKDIQNRTGKDVFDSNSHYWINLKPDDPSMEKWYEASVSHLGIRLIWIDDWKEVGLALQKAVGL